MLDFCTAACVERLRRRDLARVGDGEVVAPARQARRLLVDEDPVIVGRLEVVRELEGDLAADDAVALGVGVPPPSPSI